MSNFKFLCEKMKKGFKTVPFYRWVNRGALFGSAFLSAIEETIFWTNHQKWHCFETLDLNYKKWNDGCNCATKIMIFHCLSSTAEPLLRPFGINLWRPFAHTTEIKCYTFKKKFYVAKIWLQLKLNNHNHGPNVCH